MKKHHDPVCGIKKTDTCSACSPSIKRPFYCHQLFIVCAVIAAYYILGWFVPLFRPAALSLSMYLSKLFWPVALGLLLGGVIDWLVPHEYVSKLLAGHRKRTIFAAVLTGFLMSACSHGILALSIQLYKKGASVPAVIAFLLASPWANLPVTILMFGFFGWKAALIIGAAIVVAVISGHLYLLLAKGGLIEENPHTITVAKDFSIAKDIRQKMAAATFSVSRTKAAGLHVWQGAVALGNMVLWWILLGALLASTVAAFVPKDFMMSYMGASFLGLLVTIAVATVLEVCSEGTAPLAFEIYRQTGAFGNAFVFLMAGVVTDYTEIGLLWTNIGKKTALWLPVIAVPQVIVLGIVFNAVF
ncbi:permease [Candidatus Margulisiibacteriota bacterium]